MDIEGSKGIFPGVEVKYLHTAQIPVQITAVCFSNSFCSFDNNFYCCMSFLKLLVKNG